MSFNPNAGSFNPNAGSFNPSGGAPPFQPGQQYQQNPYGQQQQQGGPAFNPQTGGYYAQYGQQQGGYGGYGAPQQGYYNQQQGGYGGYNNGGYNNNQYNNQYNQQQQPQQPETKAYVPQARAPVTGMNTPFVRKDDPDAPAPPKTMSLSIGGNAKPATVSLSIGGKKPAAAPAKAATPAAATPAASSKANTPASTKASTPTPEAAAAGPKAAKKAEAAAPAAAKAAPAAAAKKADEPAAAAASNSKTADAVAEEAKASVDEETLKDLYGDGGAEDKDVKPHVNVVFIGHVDAGKSTMGGNILYLCGMVDKRTLEKYEREAKEAGRESWYLSWALDSTSQEREKGKTVEAGRAYFETPTRRYTILDAPGHKTYVPSMISASAQADVAVLVISARKGEFETGYEKGGQTREHAMLVKTAGVQRLIVVINKMDDPTVNWDKDRYDEIVGKLTPFLKGTGYNVKTDVTFIPVSGFTGANLKDPVDKAVAPWVEGDSLLNFLDGMPLQDRKSNAPLMMPISEKYSDMGTVIVGKVESGRLRKGQDLLLMPNKNKVQVTGIHNEMEEEVQTAISGDNVRVRLKGVEDEDISIGFVLTSVQAPVHAVTQFEAQLVILDTKNIITAGYGAVMHVHTLAEEVILVGLLHYYDKKTGKKSRKPPQFAKKGMKVIALLEAAATVCVETFKNQPQLGRFTLRDEGKTVAIGKITKLIERVEDLPDVSKLTVDAANA